MRYAILSDMHGNSLALEAVLTHIDASGGADAYWLLGDYAAMGPDPAGVLARITQLPNARFVRGNTDRYLITMDRPAPGRVQAMEDEAQMARYLETLQTFAWSHGAVVATGWRAWLADLPLELRMTLPDGTRVLGVHAAPGTDDGRGIQPMMEERELRAAIADAGADLIFVGHTHWPLERRVDDVHIVNIGSVSLPNTRDRRASYVMLTADDAGYEVAFARVDYDREAVVASLVDMGHPGRAFLTSGLRGERPAPFPTPDD